MSDNYTAAWLQTWVAQNINNNAHLHTLYGDAAGALQLQTWESDETAGACLIGRCHYAEITLRHSGQPEGAARVETVRLNGPDGRVIRDASFNLNDDWGLYRFWQELVDVLDLDRQSAAKVA